MAIGFVFNWTPITTETEPEESAYAAELSESAESAYAAVTDNAGYRTDGNVTRVAYNQSEGVDEEAVYLEPGKNVNESLKHVRRTDGPTHEQTETTYYKDA